MILSSVFSQNFVCFESSPELQFKVDIWFSYRRNVEKHVPKERAEATK